MNQFQFVSRYLQTNGYKFFFFVRVLLKYYLDKHMVMSRRRVTIEGILTRSMASKMKLWHLSLRLMKSCLDDWLFRKADEKKAITGCNRWRIFGCERVENASEEVITVTPRLSILNGATCCYQVSSGHAVYFYDPFCPPSEGMTPTPPKPFNRR